MPLFYWHENKEVNFGDLLSLKLVERIVGRSVRTYKKKAKWKEKKLLAIGSILYFAGQGDVVWGSGINGKKLNKKDYEFTDLDVRAIRGPLSKDFLEQHFNISVPEIYGDPGLLFPYFFPEFKRKENPSKDYVVIFHYLDECMAYRPEYAEHAVSCTAPWTEVIEQILDSKFVISSSLHGIVIAEAYGIPARMLRLTEFEPLFKFQDYYFGTNRFFFEYARSVEEALEMGGEPPFECDLRKLYEAFPFEYWPDLDLQPLTTPGL